MSSETYTAYLAKAERDIASGKRKQLPMTEVVWSELNKIFGPRPDLLAAHDVN